VLAISLALFHLPAQFFCGKDSDRRVAVNKVMQGLTTGVMQAVLGVLG
jgi:hypothetical protein